ncbi:hypothetical protein JAAARDRAFT_206027 [Jaapia argillacea MUCL 33604]|uniref:F-box domain-containing protein n=1 Tax=Jaapia argillacea MUCL 33604 TaxID=933084 RepID=A0A067Q8W4_9AGAM|nr:hypothetical protein JAAARDRAFT_206027 [Jaapia argillacea MUCL 33604]
MPLEINFMIFRCLQLRDLLHLCWTSKAIRDELMRRSSSWIWKIAHANVENLPECPSGMNEAQFAHLLYHPYCHYCGIKKVQNVFWVHYVRCCMECRPTHFTYGDDFSRDVSDLLVKLLPSIEVTHHSTPHARGKERIYSRQAIGKFIDGYNAIPSDGRAMYLLRHSQRLASTIDHAQQCQKWMNKTESDRFHVLEAIRKRRMSEVRERLKELGWEEELKEMDMWSKWTLHRNRSAWQARELTPRIWANIEPKLIEFMQNFKKKRLEREHFYVFEQRWRIVEKILLEFALTRPPTDILPRIDDLLVLPEVKEIVERPDEDMVARDDFAELALRLPEISQTWLQANKVAVLSLMPNKGGDEDTAVGEDTLTLATTYFCCGQCRTPISYPRILGHGCCCKDSSWTLREGTTFDITASNIASHLVSLCGSSPLTMTASEMDTMDPRLSCGACESKRGRKVMDWRSAVNHHLGHYPPVKLENWSVLNEPDTAKSRNEEESEKALKYVMKTWNMAWGCTRCLKVLSTRAELSLHLDERHKVKNATATDMFVKPDAAEYGVRRPPFVRIQGK